MQQNPPFAGLNVDKVIDAVESLGYLSDLRVMALNSYENRVYQIGIEEEEPLIAKFYRPERWTDEQIIEEHRFSHLLAESEIPIIAPICVSDAKRNQTIHTANIENTIDKSLFSFEGFRFSLFRRRGGHAPDLENLDTLDTLGQHIGRIHAIGAANPFKYRSILTCEQYSQTSREYILNNAFIPPSLLEAYSAISEQLLSKIKRALEQFSPELISIHGDCHPGNILSRPDSLYLVDLDDCCTGPAIQDLWMLISGDRNQQLLQLSALVEGYESFHEFDRRELQLIEPLRAMRLIYYAGWLARRWHDPAFPLAFPWFNTERYWAEHILELKEQLALLDEPALDLSRQ